MYSAASLAQIDWLITAPTLLGAFILGAIMGSFACCQAWRLRLREQGKPVKNQRSICLSCKKQLKWYENIPVISWLAQRGRCRHCRAKIGGAEIVSELGLGLIFATLAFYATLGGLLPTPDSPLALSYAALVLLYAITTALWLLLIYDAKWGRLPTKVLISTIILAALYAALQIIPDPSRLLPTLGAVAILAGVYYLLYFFSHEKLVGSGDWLLCLAIALLLGHWWLALAELFLANALALLGSLPATLKKHQKARHIHFGPYLIIAFILIFLSQAPLLSLVATLF